MKNPGKIPEELYLTAVNVTFVLKGKLSEPEINSFVDYLNEKHDGGRDYFAALLREYASQKIKVRGIL